MTRYLSNLAGLAFRSPEAKLRVKELRVGDTLILKRDRGNQYDENAIEVHAPDPELSRAGTYDQFPIFIGFCEKLMNGPLAQDMDHGKNIVARVSNVYDDYDQPVKTGNWARPLIEVISTDKSEDDESDTAA